MKIVQNQGAQGDLLLRRIEKLPDGLEEVRMAPEGHVLAHSETGHHHVVEEPQTRWLKPVATADAAISSFGHSMVSYLEVLAEHADVVHHRDEHQHETLRLPKGLYEVRRQREHDPFSEPVASERGREERGRESWRSAAD